MLSYFALELGDFDGARAHATKGLALARKPGGDPREAATFHARLGRVLKDAGSYQPALEHFQQCLEINRRLYGTNHPTTIRAMLQAARGQQQAGNESAGVALAEQALRVARGHAGKAWHDDQLVRCLHMVAIIYQHAGRYSEQEALLQERLELVRRRGGADAPETLHALADLGVLRFQQRRFSESESLLDAALKGQRQRLGDDYPQTFETMIALARCRAALHQTNEARVLFDEVLERSARALGAASPYRRDWLRGAIEFFETNGDPTRAATLAEQLSQASAK
jgi:tetratricopeptide (TPR) repeat protein